MKIIFSCRSNTYCLNFKNTFLTAQNSLRLDFSSETLHKNQPESALQASLTVVWSALVTQHMTAYCHCAVHKPSVRCVQMKGCGWGLGQAARRPGEERWELGVAAAELPWYSPNELHYCFQHEPSLLHNITHSQTEQESRSAHKHTICTAAAWSKNITHSESSNMHV